MLKVVYHLRHILAAPQTAHGLKQVPVVLVAWAIAIGKADWVPIAPSNLSSGQVLRWGIAPFAKPSSSNFSFPPDSELRHVRLRAQSLDQAEDQLPGCMLFSLLIQMRTSTDIRAARDPGRYQGGCTAVLGEVANPRSGSSWSSSSAKSSTVRAGAAVEVENVSRRGAAIVPQRLRIECSW